MAKFKADFTNVGDGPGLLPAGDYVCKVGKITVEQGDKGKYLKWELVVALGEQKGKKKYHNTSLLANALFNLRNTIIACGIDVPKSAFSVDTDKYTGKIIGITVADSTYKKDGVEKKSTEIIELWRVVKTAKGYGRATAAATPAKAAAAVIDETEDEEEDLTGSVNGQSDEGVEEIEIE